MISEKFVKDVAFSLGIVLSIFISVMVNFAIKNLFFLLIIALLLPFSANALYVEDIRLTTENNSEIIEIELDEVVGHRAFLLDSPNRLVVDLPPFKWKVSTQSIVGIGSNLIGRIRYALFDEDTSRIVMDLHQAVTFEQIISANKRIKKIRLIPKSGKIEPRGSTSGTFMWQRKNNKSRPPMVIVGNDAPKPVLPTSKPQRGAKPLIVIDAGHGGKDSGAIGTNKTKEKVITLRYARALRDALEATGNYRVKLTRDSDKIIVLRDRFRIARRAGADLFLSLHADSAPNHDARGLSVYTLSETASDAEAEALAKQENRVDVLADVDLTHEDEEVASILIDLTRRETKNKSVKLAESIVGAMKGSVNLLKNSHRHAGFAVLKAPDIPSVLVEIGFLTNKQEERLITQKEHQDKVISGLKKGINNYFAKQR